mgnify:CR=1 FL=1
MKISSTMDLAQLAERMGDVATEAEARHMRATLEGLGAWERTEDVPENEWLRLIEAAVAQAEQDEPEITDAALESAFADAIGHDKYQRLLDEQWLPFEGTSRLSLSLADAVAREVKAATEFLQSLDDGETSIARP